MGVFNVGGFQENTCLNSNFFKTESHSVASKVFATAIIATGVIALTAIVHSAITRQEPAPLSNRALEVFKTVAGCSIVVGVPTAVACALIATGIAPVLAIALVVGGISTAYVGKKVVYRVVYREPIFPSRVTVYNNNYYRRPYFWGGPSYRTCGSSSWSSWGSRNRVRSSSFWAPSRSCFRPVTPSRRSSSSARPVVRTGYAGTVRR